MEIQGYTGGHVFTNGYLIQKDDTCIVIDAPARIDEWIEEQGATPTHLLLTHQHFDHVEAVEALQEKGIQVLMHSAYEEKLIRQKEARENWGLPVQITPFSADRLLEGENTLTLGELTFEIYHIPGHSLDSIAFYCAQLGVVFCGDTLMAGGCGRTDLPGGSAEMLFSGIRKHLFTLPDDTVVLSGHGPATTIAAEKGTNLRF